MMRHVVNLCLICAVCSTVAQGQFPDHCADGSALPFAAIEMRHPIDDRCGLTGNSSAPANSKLQIR